MTAIKTNYKLQAKSTWLKSTARQIIALPFFNPLIVALLRLLPNMPLKSRIPVLGSGTLFLKGSQPLEMLRADRCDIARELFWGNGHLHSPCDRLSLDLAAGLSADSDLFLDIGAYTGLFALAVARQNGHIRCDAFEIVPENFQLMWQNTIANNLVTRVMPKLLGIGACNGSVKVPSSLGCGTLASSVALDSEAPDGVTIPVAVLDDLYAEFNGKMVIKIDVEGFEWQVFHGGQELLRRVRPDIVSEILRKAPKVPEMQDFLHSVGYRIFHITSSGLVLSKNILPVKNERDWLFTIRTSEELKALGYSVLDES